MSRKKVGSVLGTGTRSRRYLTETALLAISNERDHQRSISHNALKALIVYLVVRNGSSNLQYKPYYIQKGA
jgi:hypothetical protein